MAVGATKERRKGFTAVAKFAMCAKFLSVRGISADETSDERTRPSVRHFVGQLLLKDFPVTQRNFGVVPAHFQQGASGVNDTPENTSTSRLEEYPSVVSLTSSEASDSAIASHKDDDSDVGSMNWPNDETPGSERSHLKLSMMNVDMKPCTVTEKVQRWKDTISRPKTYLNNLERKSSASAHRCGTAFCYGDSPVDTGMHSGRGAPSMTTEAFACNAAEHNRVEVEENGVPQRQSLQMITQQQIIPPLNAREVGNEAGDVAGDAFVDTSAESSLAFDSEDTFADNCWHLPEGGELNPRSQADAGRLLLHRRRSIGSDSRYTEGNSAEGNMRDSEASEFQSMSLPVTDESADAEDTQEVVRFMDSFVTKIFEDYNSISPREKHCFGAFARSAVGRSAFARALDGRRAGRSCLSEGAFLSLAQSIAVMLFESCEARDWSPAKVLMNMCFTFYTEEIQQDDSVYREYLYSHLSSLPIWKNLQFWNAAFFEAILSERAKFLLPSTSGLASLEELSSSEEAQAGTYVSANSSQPRPRPNKEEQRQCLENVTFSQLAAFTHNMHAFGLPAQMCLDFLNKQLVIGNLPPEQTQLLRENVESLYRLQSNEA